MGPFYIIYPKGDTSKISILDFEGRHSYELNDWKRASRREFYDLDEAIDYAKELAKNYNLQFENEDENGNIYLD